MVRAFSSSVACSLCLTLCIGVNSGGLAQESPAGPPASTAAAAQSAALELTADSQTDAPPPTSDSATSDSATSDSAAPDSASPESASSDATDSVVGDDAAPAELTTESTTADAGAQPARAPMPLSTPESVASSTSAEAPAPSEEARQERLKDLLSLVTDNTLKLHPRENRAYYALVKEVLSHTPEELRSQARKNPRFNEFYQDPAKHRGELVHLVVNLRRVLPIDIKVENEAGVTKLYELWGWTDEAKAWMYCCVTPELPPGFPSEGEIAQRVELTGYFFKMQAYQPGDAAPNARNLVAPLVIGRITSAPKAPLEPEAMGNWPLYLIGGFGLVILLRVLMQVRAFSRPGPTQRHYRRRPLEPLDADSLSDSLGSDRGLPIRNADE